MGRRNDIDWERVERSYIAGQKTIQQVSEECNVTEQAIRRKAKSRGWQRNIAEAIRLRSQEKIAQIDIAHLIEQCSDENSAKSSATIKQAIEEASNAAAGVVLRHRKLYKEQLENAAMLEAAFVRLMESGACTDLGELARASASYKTIIDAKQKITDAERKSYSLDEVQKQEDDRDVDAMPASEAWKVVSESLK